MTWGKMEKRRNIMQPILAHSTIPRQPKMNELFLLKEAVSKITPFPIYNKFEVLAWDLPKEIEKPEVIRVFCFS